MRFSTGQARRLGMLVSVIALIGTTAAHAELMLYPTRIIIEPSKRSAQIELLNRGTVPESYRIVLVNRRMTEKGEIVEAKEAMPDERFANSMIIYGPRQVTLQPGVPQVVRLTVRRPQDLEAGEYRTHLQFDRLADPEEANDVEKTNQVSSTGLSITLKALVGVSIPVIVRQGDTHVEVKLDEVTFAPATDKSGSSVAFNLNRTGNRSIYGDIKAFYTAPGKKPVEVGTVGGLAVYVPNAQRQVKLALNPPKGVVLRGGLLMLEYRQSPDLGAALIAQNSIPVP